jgi:hypothetical protein
VHKNQREIPRFDAINLFESFLKWAHFDNIWVSVELVSRAKVAPVIVAAGTISQALFEKPA